MIKNKFVSGVLAALCALSVTACGHKEDAPKTSLTEINDDWEGWNRRIFAFNMALDDYALAPVAKGYDAVTPATFRYVLRNFSDYLYSPINMANALLQWNGPALEHAVARFAINTTFGGLGMLDAANDFGFPARQEDFGQTLAVWGVGDGGYYVMPVFGPTTIRAAFGRFGDFAFDPLTYMDNTVALALGKRAYEVTEFRALNYDTIEALKSTSDDYYAAVRSVYLQRREADIRDKDLYPEAAPEVVDFDAE